MSGPASQPFPVVRHLSRLVTPALLRLPVTANQVTALSLAAGIAACWHAAQGTHLGAVTAGVWMVVCYVLDNCDGEVARAKNQCSTFGMHFDTFVDWLVHAGFFAGLGWGVAAASGKNIWFHLGLVAAAGATVNYGIGLFFELRGRASAAGPPAPEYRQPQGARDWVLYAFRELTRADFCFIVLGLGAFDALWLLVPFGAVGAQVYWITQFIRGARDFHV
ncbi:MAG TPA: CDP-alcohol phosphatidyltransferase family protein [Rhodospirillales bacterium]|jgi:phosphatidylglycerophosphate synthase